MSESKWKSASVLTRAFLFKPYGDFDLEYAKDLQLETGLNSVHMKNWFIVIRDTTNLEKFWRIEIDVDFAKLDYLGRNKFHVHQCQAQIEI